MCTRGLSLSVVPLWVTAILLSTTWLAACAPSLDWREVRPAGTSLQLLLPCKPTSQQRRVSLAKAVVPLTLYACQAGDLTWAVSHADVLDPALVAPALAALRAAAQVKMGAPTLAWAMLPTAGATPNAQSGFASFALRAPQGEGVQMQTAVFAQGTRVFQATVLGAAIPAEAASSFFSSLRLNP
jgi:hypothetical protein